MPLNSRLPRIAASLRPQMEEIVKQAAEQVANDAKTRVPVDSGDLRDAIHVENKDDLRYQVVAGDREVFYGHLVEFGTAHSAARPFLIPALHANRDDVVRKARRALRGV